MPAGGVSLNSFVDHWDYAFHCKYLSNEDSLLANDFFLFNLKDKRYILLSCFKTFKGFFLLVFGGWVFFQCPLLITMTLGSTPHVISLFFDFKPMPLPICILYVYI